MIYTSYFSSKKYNKEDGVSIARYTKFWNGPVYEKLYPSKTLLSWWKHKRENGQHKDPMYTRQYIQAYYEETLSKLDPYEVAKELDGKVLFRDSLNILSYIGGTGSLRTLKKDNINSPSVCELVDELMVYSRIVEMVNDSNNIEGLRSVLTYIFSDIKVLTKIAIIIAITYNFFLIN